MPDVGNTINFNENQDGNYAQKITSYMKNAITNGFVQKKYIPQSLDNSSEGFFYFVDGYYDASTLNRLFDAFHAYRNDTTPTAYEHLNSILNDFLKAPAKLYDVNGHSEDADNYDSSNGTFYRLVSGIEQYDTGGKDSLDAVKYSYRFTYTDDGTNNLENIPGVHVVQGITDNFYLIPVPRKDENGLIKYTIGYVESMAYQGLALPYLALAVLFEKSLVQQDILLDEINQVDAINNKISYNNNMLNAMNIVAQKYYALSIVKNPTASDPGAHQNGDHFEVTYNSSDLGFSNEITVNSLNTYLSTATKGEEGYTFGGDDCTNVVINTTGDDDNGTLLFKFAYTDSDNNNTDNKQDGDYSNIDVTEQGAQTGLSNMQDAIRSYGDKCTTAAQMANTYMQQYMQAMNSTINLGTQMCKNIGDYYKSITNNIR